MLPNSESTPSTSIHPVTDIYYASQQLSVTAGAAVSEKQDLGQNEDAGGEAASPVYHVPCDRSSWRQ